MTAAGATAFTLYSRGAFALGAAARFAETFPGTTADRAGDGEVRFAWAVDGDWRVVEATLRQDGDAVRGELAGDVPADLARAAGRDAERFLCLDVDGSGFAELGRRDPVVGGLQRRFAGLRPVLFFTPYEAAAWTIVGQRIRMAQAAVVRQRLAAELGEHGAFPAPAALAGLATPQRGLTDRKVGQLRELAAAALDGRLGRDRLRTMDAEDAARELQRLPGIGPFSAELILIRGAGDPDALPVHERRSARAARDAYGLPDDADVEPAAEAWRPYRSWVTLLLRLAQEEGQLTSGCGRTGRGR